MKEKILVEIYNKLCEGFDTKFFSLSQFRDQNNKHHLNLTNEIIYLSEKYNKFKNSKNKEESNQVVKVFKDEYIVDCYNNEHKYYKNHQDYSITNIKNLKKEKEYYYTKYENEYKKKFNDNNSDIIISFNNFVKEIKKEFFTNDKTSNTLSFETIFWNFFNIHFYLWNDKELKVLIDEVFDRFRNQYLNQEILKVYEIAKNQISDIDFTGIESTVINIGKRTYQSGNSGWIINNFEVLNNKKTFYFSNSTKDESRLTGMFVNIFLLQLNKKHLLKISITVTETDQTPFIIWKDFEKISLKNDCEIYISKHHSNESIIFDSKKEALNFQGKVLEIKEGRNNNFR